MKFLKQACLLTLATLLFANNACATSDCVFDQNIFSESRYQGNPHIAKFVWSDAAKQAKGITKSGAMFSVKHWACDHYGTHAVMFLGPYFPAGIEDIDRWIMQLADIALQKNEVAILADYLSKKPFVLSGHSAKVQIDTQTYADFHIGYRIAVEVVVLEIKLYRN